MPKRKLPAPVAPGAGLVVSGDRWGPVLAAWQAEVAKRSGSLRTPDTYRREMRRFLAAIGSPAQATPAAAHAFAYAPGPSGRSPSPSTITVRLAAIRSFYDFARRMGLLAANPADDVRRPRNREPIPRGLTVPDLRRLLEAVPDTPAGRRDRAVIVTIVLTGLRRAELFSLTAGDLEGSGEQLTYTVRVKGGHRRRRELPGVAAAAIAGAHDRDVHLMDNATRLFPCTPQAFYANLARYARRAGLGHVAPHALRHTAAKLRRDAGASLEEVSTFLGHKSLATTSRYLARLEGEADPGWRRVADLVGL